MKHQWLFVLCVGGATALLKAAGPVLLGGRTQRSLPARVAAVIALLPPAVFGALIVTQAFARGEALVVDARVGGLAAAVAGSALRVPPVLTLAAAVLVTATLRHLWR